MRSLRASRTVLPGLLRALVPLLLGIVILVPGAAFSGCDPQHVTLRGAWGQARFAVELAVSAEERGRGLMYRTDLARNAGMLFIFDPPQPVSFWMRNTFIPLDMIFADRAGTVVRVHSGAVPRDETPIPGGGDIFAVLEINGGLAQTMGIAPGTQLQHPLFGDAAVWPCGES